MSNLLVSNMTEDYEEAGQRYAYLLQPIKDLHRNFDINIAKELDDYCARLDELAANEEFQIDNAHRFVNCGFIFIFFIIRLISFNFYYRYFLKIGLFIVDEEVDEGLENDVDIDPEANLIDPCDLCNYSKAKPCNPMDLVMKYSKVVVPTISVMPMSLMPLADFEKCNVPLYTCKNNRDIIGKKDDFKINTGYMGRRGALLLDLLNTRLLDDFASDDFMEVGQFDKMKEISKAITEIAETMQDPDSGRGSPVNECIEGNNFDGRPSNIIEVERRGTPIAFTDLRTSDDNRLDSNALHVVAFNEINIYFLFLNFRPITQLSDAPNADFEYHKARDFPVLEDDFSGNCFDNDFELVINSQKKKPWETVEDDFEPDPMEHLVMDPFDDKRWKSKPIDIIKRVVRATTIVAKNKKVEKTALTMQKRTMQTIEYVNEHFYMKSKKVKSDREDDWQTDALYRFIVAQQKKRAQAKRDGKKQQRPPRRTLPEKVISEDEDLFDDGIGNDDELDIHNDEVVPHAKADGIPSISAIQQLLFNDIEDDELQNSINIPSLYIGRQPNAEGVPDEDDLPVGDIKRPTSRMSLQDLLQYHMNRYWSTTAEATSKLAARVQDWDERMQPILEEEETRKEFDIHEYGTELLEFFTESGEMKSLSELLIGKKEHEISRYFLSCLMMANTYNVRVSLTYMLVEDNQQQGLDQKSNTMRVTLLSRERHHKIFNQDGAL
uniref:CNDH2_C domain-containing protein n=1 Tax=Heterorhabditis bacteriophora TaxID=37862 RepID=A0A1I7XRG4_HETBA